MGLRLHAAGVRFELNQGIPRSAHSQHRSSGSHVGSQTENRFGTAGGLVWAGMRTQMTPLFVASSAEVSPFSLIQLMAASLSLQTPSLLPLPLPVISCICRSPAGQFTAAGCTSATCYKGYGTFLAPQHHTGWMARLALPLGGLDLPVTISTMLL